MIPGGTLESLLTSKPAPDEHGKYENIKCALNDRELMKIALQIATGMQHLESKKVRGTLCTVYLYSENIVPKCLVLALQENIAKFYAASNAKKGNAFHLLRFATNCQ